MTSVCAVLIKSPRGGKSFGPKNTVLWKSFPWHPPRFKTHITKSPHLHHHQFLLLSRRLRDLFFSLLLLQLSLIMVSPCSSHSDLWKPKSKWLPSVPKIKSSCPVGAGKALHMLAPLTFSAFSYANLHDEYTPATLLSLLPLSIRHAKRFPSLGPLYLEHSSHALTQLWLLCVSNL